MTDDIVIDVPTAADWDEFYDTLLLAFHEEFREPARDAEELLVEIDRLLLARRGGRIVGTAGILTRRLGVPGGTLPAAHVTLISVAAPARRQGILNRFVRRQFDDARAAGEPIAVLWASEGRIYQRYGYGLAAQKVGLNIDTREVELLLPPTEPGRLRDADPIELRDILVKLYDEAYVDRPGWSERAARHWDYRLADLEHWRAGATRLRGVVYDGDNGVEGYALWRSHRGWGDTGPAAEVRVVEQLALSPAAYAALWRFLITIDLTRTTSVWSCSPDEPILFAVNEPRRLDARLTDALWVRVLDVPAALAGRRYATDIDVVIEVVDPLIEANAGRWRLRGSPTRATCESTVDSADLSCDIRGLGAAFLGGPSLVSLAATGQVRELRPGALERTSVAFGWHRAPSSIEVF